MGSKELETYLDAHKDVALAEDWLSNSDKCDSQSGKRYSLAYLEVTRATFCGQAYAGAKNYHDAPKEFLTALSVAAANMREQLFAAALRILRDKERAALVECEAWLGKMQERVAAAKAGTVTP